MTIDILIPTYKRADDLRKNLELLYQQIEKANLFEHCQVMISDNCSPDHTQQTVEEFKALQPKMQVHYFRNEKNIGLEPNAVAVLRQATSPYVLFLGDDDFLAEGYLVFCLEQIENQAELGCVIPGLTACLSDGTEREQRQESFDQKELSAGFESMLTYSHLGHQMSGVLCLRKHLLEDYLDNEEHRNPYLFLYFTANRLYKYGGIYTPQFKTLVNAFNAKDWGYNEVGLLDEVYKCYYPFVEELGVQKVSQLLLRFTVVHSYRLAFKSKNPVKLYKQYKALLRTTPKLKGFKAGLRKMFLKDYLKGLVK